MLASLLAPVIAACSGGNIGIPHVKRAAFTEKEFGVKASPRVTNAKNPPKGGGRYLVGQPYTVRGEVYEPLADPSGYVATGTASWYGNDFHGRLTANGEIFAGNAISCASPVLPLPSYVRVTNLDNGRSVVCRVNDRGPYMHGRVMDLSYRTAEILGYANKGVGNIQVQYVGPAPLNGDDTRMLLASVDRPTSMERGDTRFAMNGNRSNATDLIGDMLGNMFGYAEESASAMPASDALAAATAVASADAVPATPPEAQYRQIRLQLGVFSDESAADAVVERFAVLGAILREDVRIPGADAVRLRLTELKPGVGDEDVTALARELGLDGLVLY